MAHPSDAPAPGMTGPDRLTRLAAWCAYASGVVCIFGIVFLVALYVSLFTGDDEVGFGPLNDISVIVQYTLALPIVAMFYRVLGPYGPTYSLVSMLIGIVGMIAAIVLQVLLVAGVLSFGQQVGMVIVAFMVILAWFVMTARLARSSGELPNGMLLYVLAGLYFGYPVWAFSLGRRLLRRR